MAETLESAIELDISDALGRIDEVRTALDEALAEAGATGAASIAEALAGIVPEPLPIEADTTAVAPEIEGAVAGSAPEAVPVEADPSAMPAEIVEAASGVEVPPIPVDADTSEAQQALDDLGSSAASASPDVAGLKTEVSGLNAASGLATGSAAGLGDFVGNLGGKAGVAVGGVVALAGATGVLFNEAQSAQAATQRFGDTFGPVGAQIERVDIGNLNTDLSTLALQLGSDDDALRQAASSFGQLGLASGASRKEVAQSAEEIVVLSARAVALKPSLGDAADVAEGMSRALSRGGRFASQYGIDLSSAEISQRAMANSGKASAAELTFYEKAAAGAQLATEKYGGSLEQVIARGARNSDITLARLRQTIKENTEELGKPIVAPVFELLETSIPVAKEVGTVLAELAEGSLPGVIAGVQGLLPVLTLAVDLLEVLPAPVLASVVQTYALSRAFSALGKNAPPALLAISALLPLVSAIDPGFASAATSVGGFAFIGSKLGSALPNVSAGMGALAGAGIGVGQAVGGAAGQAISFASAGALLGQALIPIPVVGAAAGAAVGALGGLLLGSGEDAKKAHQEIVELAGGLKGLSAQEAAHQFLEEEINLFGLTKDAATDAAGGIDQYTAAGGVLAAQRVDNLKDLNKDFKDLAETAPASAARVLEGLEAQRGSLNLTDAEFAKLHTELERGAEKHAEHARNAEQDAQAELQAKAAAGDAAAALQLYSDALDRLNGGHLTAFEAETALAQATADLSAKWAAAGGSLDAFSEQGHANREALSGAAQAAFSSSEAIFAVTQNSAQAAVPLQNLANQIVMMGSASGQTPQQIAGLLSSLGLIPQNVAPGIQSTADLTAAIAAMDPAAANTAAQMIAAFQGIPIGMVNAVGQAQGGLAGAIPGLTATGAAAGGGASAGFGGAVVPGVTTAAQQATAAGSATLSAWAIASEMSTIGQAAGGNFRQAIVYDVGSILPGAIRASMPPVVAAFGSAQSGATNAGQDMGQAFARGIRNSFDTIAAAGREAARVAHDAIRNAGSPTEHLFYDAAVSVMGAYVEGALSAREDVAAAFMGVARTAATGLPTAPGSASLIAGGGGDLTVNFNVQVLAPMSESEAEKVGAGIVRGGLAALDGETRRRIDRAVVSG